MQSYKQYLSESAAVVNSHLEHAEDAIINGGVAGARLILNYFRELRDELSGKSSGAISKSLKFDGCIHEDTIILTNFGDMKIKDIIEKKELWSELKVMGKDLESSIQIDKLATFYGGDSSVSDKKWVEIELEDGSTLKMTEDHEVHTKNRGWVKAGELEENDDITEL